MSTITHPGPSSGPPGGAKRLPRRLARLLAALAAAAIVAMGMPGGGLLDPAPAHAEQVENHPSVNGGGARPFYVYVKQGEYLYANTAIKPTYIKDQTGTDRALGANGGTYGPATTDGVWRVYVEGNDSTNIGSWRVEARTSATGGYKPGRVWTHTYYLSQTGGANPSFADLRYWVLNDTGYVYQVDMKGFNGVNSRISSSSTGNTTNSSCVSAYRSLNMPVPASNNTCGDPYRIFFETPAADLPAEARMGAASTMVKVKPPVLTSQVLQQTTQLRYTSSNPAQGTAAGRFDVEITDQFSGNYELLIDVDGNGRFTDARDVTVPLSADGSGAYSYAWDGRDSAGNAVQLAGKKLNARIHFDKVGEMHLVQRDVEAREGIRILRLNGEGTTAEKARIYWDDSRLGTLNRDTVTAPLASGAAGVSSTGYAHGWGYSPGCTPVEEQCGAWGNNRYIDDWTYVNIDAYANVMAFGGVGGISLQKTASTQTFDRVGQVVDYSFRLTNTGNLDLANVRVTDDAAGFTGAGSLSAISCPATTLAITRSMTCTASYTVQQADLERGSIENRATATGTPAGEQPVTSDPSEAVVTAVDDPSLALVKEVSNPADADEDGNPVWGPGAAFDAAEELDYRFTVTNTGNLAVTGLDIDETAWTGSGELSDIACAATELAPGASTTCTASYSPTTQADVDRGTVENTAVATGDAVRNPGISSDPSTAIAVAPQTPALHLLKTASETSFTAAGQEIDYSFEVTNVGNLTMTGIEVDDADFSGSGELSTIECPVTTLAPGTSTTCSASYTTTQADVDRGEITNAATATGEPPTGDPVTTPPSEVVVPAAQAPALSLAKTASAESFKVGDEVTYTFVATNTGNVTMTGASVEELAFTGSGELSELACDAQAPVTLAPGEALTCTATYTATQADLDQGVLENRAVAHGQPPIGDEVDSNEDSAVVVGPQAPALELVKTVSSPEYAVGDELTYTFVATNTGDVTILDPSVEELSFTGSGELGDLVCEEAATLAPGEGMVCTATYTATQADLDRGTIDNTAVAHGETSRGGGTVDSEESSARTEGPQTPGLTLVKTVDQEGFEAGDELTYSFVATNTGDVTMSDVVVTEKSFSGTGKLSELACDAEAPVVLAPGEALTCTATYTATQADQATAEPLTNVAGAQGIPGTSSDPVASNDDDAEAVPAAIPEAPAKGAVTGRMVVEPEPTGSGTPFLIGGAALLMAAIAGGVLAARRKGRTDPQ